MAINIGVVGGGSWATALVKILSEKGYNLKWWLREADDVAHILKYKHNPRYLSSVEFDFQHGQISSKLAEVIEPSDYVVVAVPSLYLKSSLIGAEKTHFSQTKVISAIKGIVPDDNIRVTDYLSQTFGVPLSHLAHISGPCHSEEVASEKLSYLTLGSINMEFALECAELFSCRYISTIATDDIAGTEFAAVLKNVYALGAGISVGLGYGDNFRAVFASQAMREMRNFLQVVVPQRRDVMASAYLGDLLVTASSPYSRNRSFGLMIGKG